MALFDGFTPWEIYGPGYTAQDYQQGLNASLSNSLFGRRNTLLDSTPLMEEPVNQPDWRRQALQNFLPGYQNMNNQFRESFGRLPADQFPYSPYSNPEPWPDRPDLFGTNVFGTPTDPNTFGNPAFPMHPVAPSPLTPLPAPPPASEPVPEPAAAPEPLPLLSYQGQYVTPDFAGTLFPGSNFSPITGRRFQHNLNTLEGIQERQRALDHVALERAIWGDDSTNVDSGEGP